MIKLDKALFKKIIAIVAIVVLVINITLFAFQKIDTRIFFTVIMFIGIMSFVFYNNKDKK